MSRPSGVFENVRALHLIIQKTPQWHNNNNDIFVQRLVLFKK